MGRAKNHFSNYTDTKSQPLYIIALTLKTLVAIWSSTSKGSTGLLKMYHRICVSSLINILLTFAPEMASAAEEAGEELVNEFHFTVVVA